DIVTFHAGTKRNGEELVTAGGRVLAVTALGSSVESARTSVYQAVSNIKFAGMQYRRDIGVRRNEGK
ncbi:MAG: phosphoribosylamine--glycine ligase, partial [Kofleriaceae bacterium]|nr:phosphoribosylamine--glycine ligase [Kofleriaceae bacterium]